jgi:hypothetical protein
MTDDITEYTALVMACTRPAAVLRTPELEEPFELELSPDCIPAGDEKKISKFLVHAFHMQDEDMPLQPVMRVMQRFLEDRLVDKAHESFSSAQTPLSLTRVFAQMSEQASSLANLSAGSLAEPFAPGWDAGTPKGA